MRGVLLSAECLTAPQTDLLLAMNDWDNRLAERYRLGKRVERIPGTGVVFSQLEFMTRADGLRLRKELGIEEDVFVLLYAAEFSPRKSQRVLIRAMKALSGNMMLALYGKGASWEACRSLASQVKEHVDLIENSVNITFYGYGYGGDCAGKAARLMADASLRQALSEAARTLAKVSRLETGLPKVMGRYLFELNGSGREWLCE